MSAAVPLAEQLQMLLLCLEWHHSKSSLEGSQQTSSLAGKATFLACQFGSKISSAIQLQPPATLQLCPTHALPAAHWKARQCVYESYAGCKDIVERLL